MNLDKMNLDDWLDANVGSTEDDDKPPREKKKPCFGGASVETLEAVESRFLGATLPLQ